MNKTKLIGLNYKTQNEKWNNIMGDYKDIAFLSITSDKVPYSVIYYDIYGTGKNAGYIYFNISTLLNPQNDDLTDLLHEIGHIMTNKQKMKRCMEEYLATQWAIDNSKKYKVKFTKQRIKEFQEYIYMWRDIGIKHNAKNIPSKEDLILKYK